MRAQPARTAQAKNARGKSEQIAGGPRRTVASLPPQPGQRPDQNGSAPDHARSAIGQIVRAAASHKFGRSVKRGMARELHISKNRKIGVELNGDAAGGNITVPTINFTVNSPDSDGFRRSRAQIEADLARAGQRSLGKNGEGVQYERLRIRRRAVASWNVR